MIMPPRMRLFVLTMHVTSSVGLLGSVACFLTLSVIGLTSRDADSVRGVYLAMDLTAGFVIMPLAFASGAGQKKFMLGKSPLRPAKSN